MLHLGRALLLILVMTATLGIASPANAWATKPGDIRLTGAELGKLMVGKHLHYVFSKSPKMTGVTSYGKDGHYAVEINRAGQKTSWTGPYHITADGQVCSTRDGVDSGESCELFVLAGKKLTKINSMDERYTPTIR